MPNQSSKVKLKPGDLVKFDRWHGIVTQVLSEDRVKVFWDDMPAPAREYTYNLELLCK